MAKVTVEFETEYNVGDVVLFERYKQVIAGIIEGFYVDASAGNSIWFNMRIASECVLTYSNGGDVAEWKILCKLDGATAEAARAAITGKNDQ